MKNKVNCLVCHKCGSKEISMWKTREIKTELGFTIKINTFRCAKCYQEYTVCPECNGLGFIQSSENFEDCEDCQGTGIIPIE